MESGELPYACLLWLLLKNSFLCLFANQKSHPSQKNPFVSKVGQRGSRGSVTWVILELYSLKENKRDCHLSKIRFTAWK